MPTQSVLLGTGLVTAAQYPYSIVAGGVEVAPTAAELESIEFQDSGDDEAGRLFMRLWDQTSTRVISEQAIVTVQENSSDQQVFLGVVQRRRYQPAGLGRYINVEAVSIGVLLDETIVVRETRAAEPDRARVQYLWGKYARWPFSADASQITQTNASIAATDLLGLTLRQALRETAALAGSTVRAYVDALGRLHWFSGSETYPAPYNVNVAMTPGGGNIAPDDLEIERDGTIKNRAYVRGATRLGSGWFQDDSSVAQYGPRETILDSPSSNTAAKARNIAQLYFGRVAQPKTRGTFSTEEPYNGWRGGQYVIVTDAQNGVTAESFRIARVTTTFTKGTGTKRYVCELGSVRASGSDVQFGDTGGAPLPASIVSDLISSGGNDTIPASVISVKDSGGTERVAIGALGGGDYGLRVTSSDGTTVIIDGTSNMFKIVATGTLTAPSGSGLQTAFADITTNLGATSVPMFLGHYINSTTYVANLLPLVEPDGLSPSNLNAHHEMTVTAQTATQSRVTVYKNSFAGVLAAYTYRYHILKEVAI